MSNHPRKVKMNHVGPAINNGGPGKAANYQPVYCHVCCVLAKRAAMAEENPPDVYPMITFEIQIVPGTGMPVSVPVCGVHLAADKPSSLIT
jgi:hypothetical protein